MSRTENTSSLSFFSSSCLILHITQTHAFTATYVNQDHPNNTTPITSPSTIQTFSYHKFPKAQPHTGTKQHKKNTLLNNEHRLFPNSKWYGRKNFKVIHGTNLSPVLHIASRPQDIHVKITITLS